MADRKLLKGTTEYVYFDIEVPRGYVWDADDWDTVEVALLLPNETVDDVDTYTDWIACEIVTGEQSVRILASTATMALSEYKARIHMVPTEVSGIAEHPFYPCIGRLVVEQS